MKKSGIFALFAAFLSVPAWATYPSYPVYSGYNTAYAAQPAAQQVAPNPIAVPNAQYIPSNTIANMPAAANPKRVTGDLPRVGSNATTTMRQYYEPSTYDRLSDSGLYVGLSAGYNTMLKGGMFANYSNQPNAYFVPGAFKTANYKKNTMIPLQLSVGAAINSEFRVDFSYTRYSGLSYPDYVETSTDGAGHFVRATATGGAITSNATMLNVYYNLDSYTGTLAGGSIRPYVGVGVGLALNTISDYVVYDGSFYSEVQSGIPSPAGVLTAISDIYAYHAGGTTENLAYMVEGGVSTELGGGILADFFVRYAGLGRVQSSGSIVVSQTEWLGTGVGNIGEAGAEAPAPYDSVFHYTNWYESGQLGMVDVGVRLRLQF